VAQVADEGALGQPAALVDLDVDRRHGRAIAEHVRPAGSLQQAQATVVEREGERDLGSVDGEGLLVAARREG
jgi:hypothetical protein